MFFGNAMRGRGYSMLATHPPLKERILRLEPAWDGTFPELRAPEPPPLSGEGEGSSGRRTLEDVLPPDLPIPGGRQMPGAGIPGVGPAVAIITAAEVLDSIGKPMQAHLDAARVILDGLPPELREAAHHAETAWAVVYLLLLDDDQAIRRRQLEGLERRAGAAAVERVTGLVPYAGHLKPEARLPALDLAMPALKQMTAEQYALFKEAVEDLVAADEQIDLFEYALRHTLLRNLDTHYGLADKAPAQIYALRGVADECSGLLSILSRFGHQDPEDAAKAFEAAAGLLRQPGMDLRFLPPEQCTLAHADEALDRLRALAPRLKRRVIAACMECISFDRKITVDEAELFRAVAAALACPVPPWVLSTSAAGEQRPQAPPIPGREDGEPA
jgi:hypothetical protein